jgi:hypothetical protein
MSYYIDHTAMTVVHVDNHGEMHDLNAGGAPCVTSGELRVFIAQLADQGAIDAATCDDLLIQVDG